MLQRPFLIYRNTPTSYSKFPLQMTPNFSSCCSERWYRFCFCDLPSRVLCAENPDLVQLKSLLAGLTLPVKSSSAEVAPEERDGKPRTTFLVYRKKISDQQTKSLLSQSEGCWDLRSQEPLKRTFLYAFSQMTYPRVLSLLLTYRPQYHLVPQTWRCTWRRCRGERQWRVRDWLILFSHGTPLPND